MATATATSTTTAGSRAGRHAIIMGRRGTVYIDDLDTPSLLIDLDRLEANIRRMAAITLATGVDLRPHAKTHKMPEVGRLQLAAGSPGLTVAKLGEAEMFAGQGLRNLFIAYPLWGQEK